MVNNEIKKENDSKKIFAMIVMILTLMLCTTSATYAYFAIAPVSNNSATGTTATASLTLAVNRIAPNSTKWSSSTQKIVPQLDTALGTAMNATNSCVDANGNVVCEVYEIKLTNGSTSKVRVNGSLTFNLTNNKTGHNFKYRLKDSGTTALTTSTAPTNLASVTTTAITHGTAVSLASQKILAVNGNYYYYFVVWVQETGSAQQSVDAGETFRATASFNAVDATGASVGGITSTITA